MEQNWLTQQINTLGKNGGWYSVYDKMFQGYVATIYISRRTFEYHINNCILNKFTLECIGK